MNQQQLRLLSKMKKLVSQGKRRFKIRNDRDYISDLTRIGITEEEAWDLVLSLNKNFYIIDDKPFYNQNKNTLTFIRTINKIEVYIKLELIEDEEEIVVCWSFHESRK